MQERARPRNLGLGIQAPGGVQFGIGLSLSEQLTIAQLRFGRFHNDEPFKGIQKDALAQLTEFS